MTPLTRPAVVAGLAVALALALEPRWRVAGIDPEMRAIAVAALALLLACAYAARAIHGGLADRVRALAAVALLVGLAADGMRAHRGVLRLAPGQGKNSFEERSADGKALGLRPLGFDTQLVRVGGSEVTLALAGGREITLTPSRAASIGAFRLGQPRQEPTGEAAHLSVSMTDESGTHSLQLHGGEPAKSGDVEVELERYFPDFALDDQQKPFSRSLHSRNPAALLRVHRGGKTYRVFVLRSMPGLHEVAELGKSFGLAGVEPESLVELEVATEPFAPLVGIGALALAASAVLGRSAVS